MVDRGNIWGKGINVKLSSVCFLGMGQLRGREQSQDRVVDKVFAS